MSNEPAALDASSGWLDGSRRAAAHPTRTYAMTATRLYLSPDARCPCGAPQAGKPGRYGSCCARFIDAAHAPPSALELMRSRYTAYTLNAFDYLRATWDPSTCPADLGANEDAPPRWLGLSVKRHVVDDDTHSQVEFVARYKSGGLGGGPAGRLHEVSRFTRGADGRWRYVDGDLLDS
jgi:SEC-C motif-containing protein